MRKVYSDRIEWTRNGLLHRIDGPAIEYKKHWNNVKYAYYINGKLHRDDGPALIWDDGTVIYYQHDKRHRTDGPAVIYTNSNKTYWINGKQLRKKEFDMYRFVNEL